MRLRRRWAEIVASGVVLALLGCGSAVADMGEDEILEALGDNLGGMVVDPRPGTLNVSAETTVETSLDSDGNAPLPNIDTEAAAGDQGGGPYDDFLLGTDNAVLCDATDENGNAVACPVPVEEIAEEAEDEITLADIQAEVLRVYQSLPVAPSPITYQPDGTWAAVNMDFIVYTDTTAQILDTTVFGVPVQFRLTPSHWTWDFGDGSPPLPTSQPGQPYPNQTLTHIYSSASDGVTITLSTLWSGEYQVGGSGDWYPVDGYVTTSSTAGPVEIVAFDVRLVPNRDD